MKTRISFIGCCLVLATLVSCKKDSESSRMELFTKQPWKLTSFIQKNLSTGAEQDNYAPM